MHGLFCRAIYYDALLEFVKEHVSGVVSHEVHVQKAKARASSGLINLHERLLGIDGTVFIEPGVEILHAPQAERERCDAWVRIRGESVVLFCTEVITFIILCRPLT